MSGTAAAASPSFSAADTWELGDQQPVAQISTERATFITSGGRTPGGDATSLGGRTLDVSYSYARKLIAVNDSAALAFSLRDTAWTFVDDRQPPVGTKPLPYSWDLPVASPHGGTLPSASITAGSLPPGLTMSSRGDVRGVPTAAGSYTFTVSVTDGGIVQSNSYTTRMVNWDYA